MGDEAGTAFIEERRCRPRGPLLTPSGSTKGYLSRGQTFSPAHTRSNTTPTTINTPDIVSSPSNGLQDAHQRSGEAQAFACRELSTTPRKTACTPQGGSQSINPLPAGKLRGEKSNGSTSPATPYPSHPWRELPSPFASEYRRMQPATRHMMVSLTVAPVASFKRRSASKAASNTAEADRKNAGTLNAVNKKQEKGSWRTRRQHRLQRGIYPGAEGCTDKMYIVSMTPRPYGTTRESTGGVQPEHPSDGKTKQERKESYTPTNSPYNSRKHYEVRTSGTPIENVSPQKAYRLTTPYAIQRQLTKDHVR